MTGPPGPPRPAAFSAAQVESVLAEVRARRERARYSGQLRQQRIRVRTLVLQGGADTVVDPRNSTLLARRIPDARLVAFPGLGHLFFWEDPGAFVRAVVDFLAAAADPA